MIRSEYAVRLSCFDGENAPFHTPLDFIGNLTHDEMKAKVSRMIDDEADRAEANGVHVHVVAEVLKRHMPDSFYFEHNTYGELVLCSDQKNPH